MSYTRYFHDSAESLHEDFIYCQLRWFDNCDTYWGLLDLQEELLVRLI